MTNPISRAASKPVAWWSDEAPDLDFEEMWHVVTARLRGDKPTPTPQLQKDATWPNA
jgi:hypothetical protein